MGSHKQHIKIIYSEDITVYSVPDVVAKDAEEGKEEGGKSSPVPVTVRALLLWLRVYRMGSLCVLIPITIALYFTGSNFESGCPSIEYLTTISKCGALILGFIFLLNLMRDWSRQGTDDWASDAVKNRLPLDVVVYLMAISYNTCLSIAVYGKKEIITEEGVKACDPTLYGVAYYSASILWVLLTIDCTLILSVAYLLYRKS
jgi:hypothetical protein